ncbi:sensor histidine kinase [Photobacterium minamisatsumaniensis]|uniref:sensor histidine kinase n=1 Tax=Photobacterium minamisatsumaniensis TaxID=2910233 RepID=UPI003D14E36E
MTTYWHQNRYFVSLTVFAAALLVSLGIERWLGSTIAVLLILQLSIVVIALQCHSPIAYIAAVIEALSFNFLFTTPRYSLQMFHLDDIINLVVFIIVAFTTSQLAERYRRQQGELKQAKLRNQILLSVSHDLRTPLAGIIGNLTTLKEYMPQLSEAEKHELLDSATTESHRLHQYIENLLQATKLQHGAMVVRKNQESLIHILNNTIARFSLPPERIIVGVDGAIGLVTVSSSLIEQALFNILDNALRYSSNEEPVTVAVFQQTHTVVIDILNKGKSLTDREAERIFDLFYTGEETKTTDSGSGLGLAVAKGVINAHHGTIECIVVPQGCQIRICLPSSN